MNHFLSQADGVHLATVEDFARRWHVSAATVRRWIARGYIPAKHSEHGWYLLVRVPEAEQCIRDQAVITWRKPVDRRRRAA